MTMKYSILFACALLGTFEAAYVDTLQACPLKDAECLKNFMQNTLKALSIEGIPEYDIPPVDPLEIKDIQVPVLNLMNITIKEAVVKGVQGCVVNKFEIKPEKGLAIVDLLCDINIKGKSKILGSSPTLENMFGSKNIHGDGNFELEFSKLHLTAFPRYDLIKKDDGEVYVKILKDDVRYRYVLGGGHIYADNIFLGEKDESKFVVDYLNQNWKLVIRTFGNNFFNVAMKVIRERLSKYSDNVGVKYFISDDLSSFVKSNK